MDVVKLLQNKTRCLQRFVDESSSFLMAAESGQVDRLEGLLESRESILRAIDLFDRKINEAVAATPVELRTEGLKQFIASELQVQAQWLARSSQIDERISSLLAAEAGRLKKEASQSAKGRKTLSKFKSQAASNESGQALDEVL